MVKREELERLMTAGREDFDCIRQRAQNASADGAQVFRAARRDAGQLERTILQICAAWRNRLINVEKGLARTERRLKQETLWLERTANDKLWHIAAAARFHLLRRLARRYALYLLLILLLIAVAMGAWPEASAAFFDRLAQLLWGW
jgi:hypothetical protein